MKKLAALACLTVAALAAPVSAHAAHVSVGVGINLGAPYYYGNAYYPYYYSPAPVYYAPPVVYAPYYRPYYGYRGYARPYGYYGERRHGGHHHH